MHFVIFLCGLRAGNITKRLLAEAKLTLKKAIDIATAMEAAAKDAVEFQQQFKPESTVHKFVSKKPTSSTACFRCGRAGHSPNQCRFKDAIQTWPSKAREGETKVKTYEISGNDRK